MEKHKINTNTQTAVTKNSIEKKPQLELDVIPAAEPESRLNTLNKFNRANHQPIDQVYLEALSLLMTEWSSMHDEQAYKDL